MQVEVNPETLQHYWKGLAQLVAQLKSLAATPEAALGPGSPSAEDAEALGNSTPVQTAIGQAYLLVECVTDHVSAAITLLAVADSSCVFASISCIRASLENAATVWWLLDPTVTCQVRVGRSIGLRMEHLKQQLSLLSREERAPVECRMADLRRRARELRAKPIGVPRHADLVRAVFDDADIYHIASGLVHGQAWALRQFGFCDAGSNDKHGVRLIRKTVKAGHLLYVLSYGAEALGKAHWALLRYINLDKGPVEALLAQAAEQIGFPGLRRFC